MKLREEGDDRGRTREEPITERRTRRRLESEPDDLSFVEKPPPPRERGRSGGGFNWGTFGASIAVAAAIMAGIMMTMAAGKGDVTRLDENLGALQGQVSALADTVAANGQVLDNVVNSQGEYAKKSDLSGYATTGSYASADALSSLRSEFDALYGGLNNADSTDSLVSLRERVEALETEQEEQEAIASETIRWKFEMPALLKPVSEVPIAITGGDLMTWVDVDGRLEDEDLYYVDLYIGNSNATDAMVVTDSTFFVKLKMKPKSSSDYALLDDSDTYLDTDDTPVVPTGVLPSYIVEPSWEAEFETKTREGQEVTRYVLFESGNITITDIPASTYVKIPLVLELLYAD
jgi:hypothetical protein